MWTCHGNLDPHILSINPRMEEIYSLLPSPFHDSMDSAHSSPRSIPLLSPSPLWGLIRTFDWWTCSCDHHLPRHSWSSSLFPEQGKKGKKNGKWRNSDFSPQISISPKSLIYIKMECQRKEGRLSALLVRSFRSDTCTIWVIDCWKNDMHWNCTWQN